MITHHIRAINELEQLIRIKMISKYTIKSRGVLLLNKLFTRYLHIKMGVMKCSCLNDVYNMRSYFVASQNDVWIYYTNGSVHYWMMWLVTDHFFDY